MKLFTTFCCAAIALCSALYAQSAADHITVRFGAPVIIGETTLPAGNCDIQVMHNSSSSVLLVFRSEAGPYTAALASRLNDNGTAEQENTSVVLDRRGDGLHLNRIMLIDQGGYQLNNVE